MTDKNYNNFIRILFILIGILAVLALLYLGDDGMNSCRFMKIVMTTLFGIISLTIIVLSVFAIWNFPCEKVERCFGKFRIPMYDTGFVLVHIDSNSESCLLQHYDTISKAFSNAEDGDVIYVFNQKNEITSNDLYVLKSFAEKNKSVILKFMETTSTVTINVHEK